MTIDEPAGIRSMSACMPSIGPVALIASAAADGGAIVVGADLVPTVPDERVTMRELDVTDEKQWDAFAEWLRHEHGACHGDPYSNSNA